MPKEKKTMETVKSLEMIPAPASIATGNALVNSIFTESLPDNVIKLTLPPMIKPDDVPMGQMVSGKIIALAPSLSSRSDMKNSKLIHMRHASGQEFLFPLTGVVKKAIGGEDGVLNNVGKTLILKRSQDGETTKYGGKKKVYMFDVYIA